MQPLMRKRKRSPRSSSPGSSDLAGPLSRSAARLGSLVGMTDTPPSEFIRRLASAPGDSWSELEPFVQELLDRPVATPTELEQWLLDRSEFDAACSETRANLYIAMTRHTDDAAAAGAWARYLDETQPPLERAAFRLDGRQHEFASHIPLDAQRYNVLNRDTAVDVELFRDENVPIQTELGKLDQEYDKITGAMTVSFDGAERTFPQMAVYLERVDRELREASWRAVAERRLQDRDRLSDIFDRMIERRHRVAKNAGVSNFRDFMFRRRKRFDYTPADCIAFHGACEELVVPALRRLDRERATTLGVSPLRPWDLSVDVHNREPLKPFTSADDLVSKSSRVFDRMGSGLGDMFRALREGDSLDLESRKGKAPGGYQYMRDFSRSPFIFMNAAGMHHDVRTMIHEAGHAFHSLLCRDEPLVHYRHSPIEFAEVASMSMELLTMDHWDEFYPDPADLARAKREQLEGVVSILPWVATIDAFQHWLYLNPSHSRGARTEAWLDISRRFGNDICWEGLETIRETLWQRQGHLFGSPFYYIEYGIAQLGALGVWLIKKEQGLHTSIEAYKRALSLGGSRPLPELFAAAGLTFDFSASTVNRLIRALNDELASLPK